MNIIEIYAVNEFGAIADEKTLNTIAVQKAVDQCHANGGGVVQFGKGKYVLSTVFLKSNVTIEIPQGTEILGAESYYDYAQEEKVDYPIYQDSSHTYFHPSMFVGLDCENIRITGGGKIDMRSVWDENTSKWWLCAVDIIEALSLSTAPRKYWNTLKSRNSQLSFTTI